MTKKDFNSQKEQVDNQITDLQRMGLNYIDTFSLRIQLSRCIVPYDLQKLQETIEKKTQEIQQLIWFL